MTWREAYTVHTRAEGVPPLAELERHRDGFRAGWLDAGLGLTSEYSRANVSYYSDGYNAGINQRNQNG